MISRENINAFWASLAIDELVRNGIELFCISPGSRSTPLTVAAARHPRIQCQVCHDERGAAFLALGYGKATGKPAALICTSGTAAANYFPAVIEASMDETPLILLTADRPPELLDAGANQTIFQDHLYGDYVRWSKTVPAPCENISPRYILTTMDQAVHRSLSTPGPVHLNCQFREPLDPSPKEFKSIDDFRLHTWEQNSAPFTAYSTAPGICPQDIIERIAEILNDSKNSLVILGRRPAHKQGSPHILNLLTFLARPVHADIGSGFRLGPPQWPVLDELTMQTSRRLKDSPPDAVLHLGGSFLSKRLQVTLEKINPEHYIHVYENSRRIDPGHIVSERLVCNVDDFCSRLTAILSPKKEFAKEDASAAHEKVDAHLAKADLCEPAIARLVSKHLPNGHALFLSNSQPIRDMNEFAVLDGVRAIVGSNRGASGIDGVIASAVGFARGLEKPTTLIIGDVAFLHDLNSLQLLAGSPQPLTVVIINNNGGGIFHQLPISKYKDVFEPFFVAPPNRTFESAAAMFGIPWTKPTSRQEVLLALETAWKSPRTGLIEITSSRETELENRKEVSRMLRREA